MSLTAGAAMKAAGGIVRGIANGVSQAANAAKYVGAGQAANAASAHAQDVAANFNQNSADIANTINANTLSQQYGFNSGQAQLANEFTQASWERAAAWNEEMFDRQMQFNAEQAQINRDWQEKMDSTKYQRAIKDMKTAGLNPVLAATQGVSVSGGGGGAASVSSPSMSSMSGQSASGGLLGANDASISGYTGQMEYYSGIMGLMGGMMNGLSSALACMGRLPGDTMKAFADLLGKTEVKGHPERYNNNDFKNLTPGTYEYNYKNKWNNYWKRKGAV